MILELDLGNSRAKWRIVKGNDDVVTQGVAELADWLNGALPDSWRTGVQRVRIASVLSVATEQALIAKIQSELSILPEVAKSTMRCCGVTNSYANPERLGVDRWLALIAAYKKCSKAVMVVDAGTALKIDVADDTGMHLGGYIIPGSALMERALLEGTERVRYEGGGRVEAVVLGRDTRACVQHGIAAALVGAVWVAIEQCRLALGRCPHVFITGGTGRQLQERLLELRVCNGELEVDLVLDGLQWALP